MLLLANFHVNSPGFAVVILLFIFQWLNTDDNYFLYL